ncbi:MAG: hypothetical protein AB1700_19230 [Bacillota bacterium]
MLLEKQFIRIRILGELRDLGCTGSGAALYQDLATLKPEAAWLGKVTERFETAPGQQALFDSAVCSISLGGSLGRVVEFCLILSFSTRRHCYANLNPTQSSVLEAIEGSFWHFRGAPKELLGSASSRMQRRLQGGHTKGPAGTRSA